MTAETVHWTEVVWVLVALVGLAFALFNGKEAQVDLTAVLRSNTNGARIMWAKFSRLLHLTLIIIEVTFVAIGVVALLRMPSPDATEGVRVLLTMLLVAASVLLTSVSVRWLRVHAALSQSLARSTKVGEQQEAREVKQDARGTRQTARTKRQDRREGRQDVREEKLDDREEK